MQAELHKALETAFRGKVETLGCGRTDTGVHAFEFFAQFDLSVPLKEGNGIRDAVYKLNSLLPKSIAVQNIFPVKEGSNARFDAISRTYKYYIHHSKNPFLVNRSCYRRLKPDVARMNNAAKLLLTHSDFSCFSKSRTQVKTSTCKIYKAEWKYLFHGKKVSAGPASAVASLLETPLFFEGGEGLLVFEIKADRFLRNMVRAIVGTLLEAGDGGLKTAGLKKILESKNRSMAGTSVPACGLYLAEVKYPEKIFKL